MILTKDSHQRFFLQPFVDSETGAIDTWPAHATKPALPLDFRGQNDKGHSKPKFLNRLENFLIKELRALDCTDPDLPSEKRLQVFHPIFCTFCLQVMFW